MRDFNEWRHADMLGVDGADDDLASAGSAADDASAAELKTVGGERRAGMGQPLLSVSGLMIRRWLAVNNVSLELQT